MSLEILKSNAVCVSIYNSLPDLLPKDPRRPTVRRMTPLSKELDGILLEHEHFGAHLNDKENTIHPHLELKNTEHAGKILGEIWTGMVTDGYPVIAKYIGYKV